MITNEEKIQFYAELDLLTEGFYQYIHRERTEPDGAITLFKRFIEFYDADWIGILDVDCNLRSWSAQCFYNRETGSTTETLIQTPEIFDSFPHWVETVRRGNPVVITDIEDTKEEYPEEYEKYKLFNVQSVIGVPYHNCNTGVLVVKNPRRFKENYKALNVMAYILTTEIIASQCREHINRMLDSDKITDIKTVKINMLGDFSIEGFNMNITRDDMKSELTRYIVAYLATNPKQYVPVSKFSEGYTGGDKETRWRDYIYKFRSLWRSRAEAPDKYQLIETCESGYRINPEINLITDVDTAINMEQAIDSTSVADTKIQLLLDYYERFSGEFLPGDYSVDWVAQIRADFQNRYSQRVIELLRLLNDKSDFAKVEKISHEMILKHPDSVDFRYWEIVAQWGQRKADAAKASMIAAMNSLEKYAWSMLVQLLIELPNLSEDTKAIFAGFSSHKDMY